MTKLNVICAKQMSNEDLLENYALCHQKLKDAWEKYFILPGNQGRVDSLNLLNGNIRLLKEELLRRLNR
jgi:hypothetical protein